MSLNFIIMKSKFLLLVLLSLVALSTCLIVSSCQKESITVAENQIVGNSQADNNDDSYSRASHCEVECIGGSCSVDCEGEGASCYCSWGFANCDCSAEEAQVTSYVLTTDQAELLVALAGHVRNSLVPSSVGLDIEAALLGFVSAVDRQNQGDFTFYYDKVTSLLGGLSVYNQNKINDFLINRGYPPLF